MNNSHNTSRQWMELGGKRHYYKSKWERNYARFLEYLKNKGLIRRWEYEPKSFIFAKIQSGTRKYVPDFQVFDEGTHFVEVKGYMDAKSNTKIKRFKKYFPNEVLKLVGKKEMLELQAIYGNKIEGWEM